MRAFQNVVTLAMAMSSHFLGRRSTSSDDEDASTESRKPHAGFADIHITATRAA